MAALQAGVTIADASIGGLGGCPFAPGATGVDLEGLIEAARAFEPRVGVRLPGQVMRAGSSLGALLAAGDAAVARERGERGS